MIRHRLFTCVTLLGCLAPWITPRHFPVHSMMGAHEPVILAWVESEQESPRPLVVERLELRQHLDIAEE